MPIEEIIRKSFQYVWNNKGLWFYGFWLAIFSGGFATNFSSYAPNGEDIKWPQVTESQMGLIIAVGIFAALILIALIIIGMIVANWSRAAIMRGTSALEEGKSISKKEIGKTGKPVIWKLIILNNIIPFAIFLFIMLIIGIFCLSLFLPEPASYTILITLILLFVMALIPFAVYLGIIWIVANRFVVLENLGPIKAIRKSITFIKGNFWWTFLLSFLYGVIGGIGGCAVGCVTFLIALIPIGLVAILVAEKIWVAAVLVGLLFIPIMILGFIGTGYFVAVRETGLTIWWLKMKNQKPRVKEGKVSGKK